MPLKRLNQRVNRDGTLPVGALSMRISLENPPQDLWAKVSIHSGKATIIISYLRGLTAGAFLVYEGRRFQVDRVVEIGLKVQLRLECTGSS